jgi:hypothetical protein
MFNKIGLPINKPDLTIKENWTDWLRDFARIYLIFGAILGFLIGISLTSTIVLIIIK